MSNQNKTGLIPTGKKKGQNIAWRIRASIADALGILDDRKTPLCELLADAAQTQPLKFLSVVAKHLPREIAIEVKEAFDASELSDNELADIIAQRARDKREQTGDRVDKIAETRATKR